MASIFRRLWALGPAAFVLKAIIAAAALDLILLAFILIRRTYRKRYFARRDARLIDFRKNWDALISGKIPWESWRANPFDRRIVESMAIDAFEAAGPKESAHMLDFLRASGLIAKLIFDARKHRGWRRHRALVQLGRTRAPEGIAALGEGLRDRNPETRLAALRGLGRMACPEAAEEILSRIGEVGLFAPELPMQTALIQTCAERPQLLLRYLNHAETPIRAMLGRVLGEVATPSLGEEFLQFAEDELDELRAAAARAFPHATSGHSLEVLEALSRDRVWFVRLRAMVSLGKVGDPEVIPFLIRGLTDSNRLVRFRSAEGLMNYKSALVSIFREVVAAGDRYGVHAFLTAMENSGMRQRLESDLRASSEVESRQRERLLTVLQTGNLAENETSKAGGAAQEMVAHL